MRIFLMMAFCYRRQSPCSTSSKAYYNRQATSIPGLHIYHDFLSGHSKSDLRSNAVNLYKTLSKYFAKAKETQQVPHESLKHNLTSKEFYYVLRIDEPSIGKINCQYFNEYGEKGHRLTYFIDNKNLPKFLTESLIPQVKQLPEVLAISENKPLNWNFTFNTYAIKNSATPTLAGFDFHTDIKSNGVATMIYSIGSASKFQIRPPSHPPEDIQTPLVSETVSLLDNSLVLLTEQSRWTYKHRVIPVKAKSSQSLVPNEAESIGRMSIVLGFSISK